MKRLVVAGMVGMTAILASPILGVQAGSSALAFSLFERQHTPPAPVSDMPVQQVQQQGSDIVQVQQLQDQIRQLNGRIEDMSYQLLQMQETIRKAQEDNEFRFQELEKKRSDAGSPGQASPSVAARQPAGGSDGVGQIIGETAGSQATSPAGGGRSAAPGEMTLGSIEMDNSGNPVGASVNGSAGSNASTLPGTAPAGQSGTKTASLGGEQDLYQIAYSHVLSGDYKAAEGEFRDFISRYPKSGKAADANFWLGEAQYSQARYKDSAETFLKAYQSYGKTPKAPEMLLKLGMSLAALDNKDTACATLREVNKRYPDASKAVQNKAASEQKRLAC
ncbi:tol-pal system protein YbgF [Agrobacterium vitis]|uniref:tol-pal system protein YbgF n=1 Tax=Agrobacterium vitis TaxID=373 RepID=UPI0015DB4080|nr:tol-pal system protein YbgF [Agrobacterium vitis]BCH63746.1 tol-pal system protein YbgF [Agrobacterium vitis]